MILTANLIHSLSRNAGGLYESVRRLVQCLREEGVGVGVFGCADQYTAADLELWKPVDVRVFQPVWPEGFGYSQSYLTSLEDYSPNLVHSHGIWLYPSMAARRYCLQKGAKSVISAHGMLDPWAVNNSRWKKAVAYAIYEKAHLVNADCLRALCASEAHSIRSLGLTNTVAVIPNGIDLPEAPPSVPAPWEGRVPAGKKVLLYLGRLHPKKGLEELLRAWAIVQKEMSGVASEWVLAIAGWDQGGHEDDLKDVASALELPWKDLRETGPAEAVSLIFTGPQFNEAKQACYHRSDAFILPSLSEGLPMVVLEAWAWNLPALITPECNLPEGFAAEAAIRIEPNSKSIVTGLRNFFAMTLDEQKAMGLRGRALVQEKFTWQTIAREMRLLYEWMLGGGERPASLLD